MTLQQVPPIVVGMFVLMPIGGGVADASCLETIPANPNENFSAVYARLVHTFGHSNPWLFSRKDECHALESGRSWDRVGQDDEYDADEHQRLELVNHHGDFVIAVFHINDHIRGAVIG